MPTAVSTTLEDLRNSVGREIACTDWLLLTQEQIDAFAEATGDRQWIHVDCERAQRESPYGTTVAHGFLTLSLLSRFLAEAIQVRGAGMAVNYGLNRVRFPAPVPAGSKIRARFTLVSLKEFAGGVEAVFSVSIEGQHTEKPVCVAEWVIRYYA
ncbi:MAG: MaoC family dehydratase [Acidobacteriia bacterium]|nr:MaoC family dehydratase [Terriglobia bacterium]